MNEPTFFKHRFNIHVVSSEWQDLDKVIQAGLVRKEAGYSVLFQQALSVTGVVALLHHHFHHQMAALVCRAVHGLRH